MKYFISIKKRSWWIFGLLVVISSVASIAFSRGNIFEENKVNSNVEITLTHRIANDVNFLIPVKYLGPKALNIYKKNRQGGRHKAFMLEFYYPSMRPNTPENAILLQKEEILYVSVVTGVQGAIRYLASISLDENNSRYSPTGEKLCELSEYKEKTRILTNHSLYHYENNEEKGFGDIYFNCDDNVTDVVPCRMEAENTKSLNSNYSLYYTLNGYPKDNICQWREATEKITKLVNIFLVKGS